MYLDWETSLEVDYYVIDIETNSLTPDTIWCMCWENVGTKETGECLGHEEIFEWFKSTKGSIYIGHNSLKFDVLVLNKLLGVGISPNQCIDTLVLTTLYKPNISGGHSLDAWGSRMGCPKGSHSDWSKLSPEMIEYCHQDVAVTSKLFRNIVNVLNKLEFSEMSCWIQHRISIIAARQKRNGFEFDFEGALTLYQELRTLEDGYKQSIQLAFPAERVLVRTSNVCRQDGEFTAIYLRDKERYEIVKINPEVYEAYEYVEFNIGSPKQRTQRLVELGWKNLPDEVTKTGLPKPFESGELAKSLQKIVDEGGAPEITLIAKWMTINGRANMINNWLENYNEKTGRIHGSLFVADTLRFKHSAPNTANVPGVRKDKRGRIFRREEGDFTYEARDQWRARDGRKLVGTDAAGLELRMLAHFLDRPAFTDQVLDGDPHQYNADLAGVDRPTAKTLLYAIQYGAQAGKVASILGGTFAEGKKMREIFLARLGIDKLMKEAQNEQRNGRITLCDGSKVVCPSKHSALNYKLQGSGARVMALASIILEGYIYRNGLDSIKVGDIHDEWQYDVHPNDVAEHKRLSVQAIREAGERLNLRIPLDATAQEGLTWAETH